MIDSFKKFLFGERKTEPCPVCGGTMVEQKSFVPDPYWDINLRCEDCGAYFDGRIIHTDVPRGEWNLTEE